MGCTQNACCKSRIDGAAIIRPVADGDAQALDFRPITPDFLSKNREKIVAGGIRLCDFTAGCLLMWRDFFAVTATMKDDMLFCLSGLPDKDESFAAKGRFYTCPSGSGDFDAAIRAVIADSRLRGIPLRFSTVPDEFIERIERAVGKKAKLIDPSAARPDFFYPYENFLGYHGKALHTHKNHVNRFLRENPDHAFVPLTDSNRSVALDFLKAHHESFQKDNVFSQADLKSTEELLHHFDKLGISGGILYVSGRPIGFTMGEAVNDTLHIHVEKAEHSVHGAHQFLAMKFAEFMQHPDLKYINRQDDAEDEGLYKSKMSYRPIELLNKNVLDFSGQ